MSKEAQVTGFCNYDIFPYVVYMTGSLTNRGGVSKNGSGWGPCFAFLPPSVGEKLGEELDGLQLDFDSAKSELLFEWTKKRDELFDKYGIKHPRPAK